MYVVAGLNHRTAPLSLREQFALNGDDALLLLRALRDECAGLESVVVSTCNRTELVMACPGEKEAMAAFERFRTWRGSSPGMAENFFLRQNRDAVQHLFRVTAGLDSLVLGETQIAGQVKDAWRLAMDGGVCHGRLDALFQQAFHVAKKIRHDTGIGENPSSVASVAVVLARGVFQKLENKRAVLVGAGDMGRLAAKHLHGAGVADLRVVNRTRAKAEEMVAELGFGSVAPWEELVGEVTAADLVIAATGAPFPVLRLDALAEPVRKRRGRPLLLLDIAVPRDVEPEIATLDGVYVYAVDDLQAVAEEGRAGRKREAELAEHLAAQEAEAFMRHLRGRAEGPLIAEIMKVAEAIVVEEVSRAARRHPQWAAQDAEAAYQLARGVARKILHRPMEELRRCAEDESTHAETVRRFFNLLGRD